jgi:hypothetical protein
MSKSYDFLSKVKSKKLFKHYAMKTYGVMDI